MPSALSNPAAVVAGISISAPQLTRRLPTTTTLSHTHAHTLSAPPFHPRADALHPVRYRRYNVVMMPVRPYDLDCGLGTASAAANACGPLNSWASIYGWDPLANFTTGSVGMRSRVLGGEQARRPARAARGAGGGSAAATGWSQEAQQAL